MTRWLHVVWCSEYHTYAFLVCVIYVQKRQTHKKGYLPVIQSFHNMWWKDTHIPTPAAKKQGSQDSVNSRFHVKIFGTICPNPPTLPTDCLYKLFEITAPKTAVQNNSRCDFVNKYGVTSQLMQNTSVNFRCIFRITCLTRANISSKLSSTIWITTPKKLHKNKKQLRCALVSVRLETKLAS